MSVTVAGREDRSQDDQNRQFGNLLLPVDNRDTALRTLWLMIPDLGVFSPDRLLAQVLIDRDDDDVDDPQAPAGSVERDFVHINRHSRLLRSSTWRRTAIVLTDAHVTTHHGR